MPQFTSVIDLPAAVPQVFDFLVQPQNLQRISPPDIDLVIVSAPERLSLGAEMMLRLRAYGQVREILHRIAAFDEPHTFRDEMINGPLPEWMNTYALHELAPGNTRLTNTITFRPPSGMMGLILTEGRILESLENGFEHRHQMLKRQFTPR